MCDISGPAWTEAALRSHQDGIIDISGAEDEAGTSSPTAVDNLASGYYRCGSWPFDVSASDKVQTHINDKVAASALVNTGWPHRCLTCFNPCA